MSVRRAFGRTGAVFAAGVAGVGSAKADSIQSEEFVVVERRSRQRELFTSESKERKARSPEPGLLDLSSAEPGSESQRKSLSRSPELRPHGSPDSGAQVLREPLEKLVPRRGGSASISLPHTMNFNFLQKTWECAEKMADNPQIRNAIQGSAEFLAFEEYMHENQLFTKGETGEIETGESQDLPNGVEFLSEGQLPAAELEERSEILESLQKLLSVPVSWLRAALSWLIPTPKAQIEGQPDEEDGVSPVKLITAFVILVLVLRKCYPR